MVVPTQVLVLFGLLMLYVIVRTIATIKVRAISSRALELLASAKKTKPSKEYSDLRETFEDVTQYWVPAALALLALLSPALLVFFGAIMMFDGMKSSSRKLNIRNIKVEMKYDADGNGEFYPGNREIGKLSEEEAEISGLAGSLAILRSPLAICILIVLSPLLLALLSISWLLGLFANLSWSLALKIPTLTIRRLSHTMHFLHIN